MKRRRKTGFARIIGILSKIIVGVLALLVVFMIIGITHPTPEPTPSPAPTATPESEPDDFDSWIAWMVKGFSGTTVDHTTVNADLGTDDPNDKILLAYLDWSVQNTYDTAKGVLEVYSNEIFAKAKEKFANTAEIVLFWHSTYLDTTIKFSFER